MITGSSAAGLTGSVKALAGRRGPADDPDRVLLPMGFRTFMQLTAEEPAPVNVGRPRAVDLTPHRVAEAARDLAPWLDLLAGAWDAYLLVGGFPTPDASVLSRQQIGMALLRSFEHACPGSYPEFDRVLHHRTATRKEIDFVGPDFGGVAIESKYVDGRWRRDAQTLAASGWRGIVATRTELNVEDTGVMAVPASMLAWLIDG